MSIFIVEHRHDGQYHIEKVCGVEDVDTSLYSHIIGIWETETENQANFMLGELKEMRHARSSQPS